jgi:predicted metal-binding protein
MTLYKNKNFTKRNYECTNIVMCESENAPNENWEPSNDIELLDKLTQLHRENGVKYYGYL